MSEVDGRDQWWWTITKFDSRCADCGNQTFEGGAVAYLPAEKRGVCVTCADRLRIDPRPSHRLHAAVVDAKNLIARFGHLVPETDKERVT